MWPTTVKIAKPAKMEVPQLTKQTRTASEKQLLLNLLYEDNAMSPPQAALSEKKICVAAFFQVCVSDVTTGVSGVVIHCFSLSDYFLFVFQ